MNKNVLLHCSLSYDALDLVDLIVHLLGLTSKIIESKFIWAMNPSMINSQNYSFVKSYIPCALYIIALQNKVLSSLTCILVVFHLFENISSLWFSNYLHCLFV